MEIVQVQGGKYNYLLKTSESRFYISDLVCEIIRMLQAKKSDEEIAQQLYAEQKVDIELTAEDIAEIKTGHIEPLGILDQDGQLISSTAVTSEPPPSSRSKAILLQKTIMGSEAIASLAPVFQWLFDDRWFKWILGATILINLILGIQFFQQVGEYVNFKEIAAGETSSLWYFLLYYPTAIFVLLIHEMGHATPAYKYGTPPKSIGFGFYLIFPVFYADVTAAWALDKKQRMIVNIGGIYLQFIVNALLLIFLPYFSGGGLITLIVLALINLNFLTLIINLNPFFKFDGYWLYSDYFGLPNLHRKASAYLRSIIFKDDEVATRELKDYNTFWLKLYSWLYLAFLIFILYLLIQGLVFSFGAFGAAITKLQAGITDFSTIFKLVTVVITSSVITVIVYQRVRKFYLSLLVRNSPYA